MQEKRIVIVGGGPAGVHMSACLAAKGYKNVTLLEAEPEVGGKSLTMYDPSQPQVPHELGTCYMSPGYTLIRKLLEEYDKVGFGGHMFSHMLNYQPQRGM